MIELAYPLGLVALLALPVLVLLHLLQPRRRRVVISTVALWQAALREREGAQGLRRLLRNLSLLLLIAAALALALGLGGPQWLAPTAQDSDIVVVLDASASMKTRSGLGTTRFDQARAQAATLIEHMPRGGRALVMTSGRRPVLRSGFETDRGALRRVLAQLRPGDEAGRPREALALALTLVRGREHARIHFITDGAFDSAADPRSPQVQVQIVGTPARNVAITRFDLRQERAESERFQVLLTVRNYTDAPAAVPVSVRLDGRMLFEQRVDVAARGEQTLVLSFAGRALGEARARIDVDDDLAADNEAFAAIDAPPQLRVLLLGREDFYLESVLAALPEVALVRQAWTSDSDLARLAREHDLVVLDGIEVPALPPGSFLLVDSLARNLPVTDTGRIARPAIAAAGTSALMRDVDLAAVRIDDARRVALQARTPGVQRLFWSTETDLAFALLDAGTRLVYLGFSPARSNFPLQAAFPLFVSHAIEWLAPRTDDAAPTYVAAGSILTLPLAAAQAQVVVHDPEGRSQTLEARNGAARYDATSSAGIYRYEAGGATRRFAVSAADADESDVNRRWTPPEAAMQAAAAESDARALLPLWPYLLAAALGLLALEWCVWIGSGRSA